MSAAWHRATHYMSRAGIGSAVVGLEMHVDDARDDVEFWPVLHEARDRDGNQRSVSPGVAERLADLVWDAAEAEARGRGEELDGPVRITVPGAGVWRVERVDCECAGDDWHCPDCLGTGARWLNKRAIGAAA